MLLRCGAPAFALELIVANHWLWLEFDLSIDRGGRERKQTKEASRKSSRTAPAAQRARKRT